MPARQRDDDPSILACVRVAERDLDPAGQGLSTQVEISRGHYTQPTEFRGGVFAAVRSIISVTSSTDPLVGRRGKCAVSANRLIEGSVDGRAHGYISLQS